MKSYRYFEWSEPETMPEEYKQLLIWRMKKQQRSGSIAFAVFLLLLFLLMFNLIISVTLAVILSTFIAQIGEKRIKKLQANNFIWRYSIVTKMRQGGKYGIAKSEVDEQSVPYIFGASVGDTVFVIGFDTDRNSRKSATFYAAVI